MNMKKYGGQHPPYVFMPPPRGTLGSVLPEAVRQGLAAIHTAGKEARALAEIASNASVKLVGLAVDATGKKGISIDVVLTRGTVRTERRFAVAALDGPLLRQLVMKAVADHGALVVEPASMLVDLKLIGQPTPTATADRLLAAMAPRSRDITRGAY